MPEDPPLCAAICLAHHGDPAGVRRLAAYFAAAGAVLFVHVDARTAIGPYEHGLRGLPRVVLLSQRQRVFWGGFSLVTAPLEAIRTARARAPFTRFCLVSEDSAPLVSAPLFARLMRQDVEYIQYEAQAPGTDSLRYENFYCCDHQATNHRVLPDARIVDPGLLGDLQRLEALRARGKFPLAQLCSGPGWWALSRRAVDYVLAEHDTNAHRRESFEFSQIPDERYVHTLLAGAPWPFARAGFVYADLTGTPRPAVYCSAAELAPLRRMPYLFARKVPLASEAMDAYVAALCH